VLVRLALLLFIFLPSITFANDATIFDNVVDSKGSVKKWRSAGGLRKLPDPVVEKPRVAKINNSSKANIEAVNNGSSGNSVRYVASGQAPQRAYQNATVEEVPSYASGVNGQEVMSQFAPASAVERTRVVRKTSGAGDVSYSDVLDDENSLGVGSDASGLRAGGENVHIDRAKNRSMKYQEVANAPIDINETVPERQGGPVARASSDKNRSLARGANSSEFGSRGQPQPDGDLFLPNEVLGEGQVVKSGEQLATEGVNNRSPQEVGRSKFQRVSGYSVVGVYGKKSSKKEDYYVEYVVGKSETIEKISKTFHVAISTFIESFAGYVDTNFIEGTKIMVPVAHHVRDGKETLDEVALKYGVTGEEIREVNETFEGKIDPLVVILPILDPSRKVVVHRYKDGVAKHGDSAGASSAPSFAGDDNVVPVPVKSPFGGYVNPLLSMVSEDAKPVTEMVALPVKRAIAQEVAPLVPIKAPGSLGDANGAEASSEPDAKVGNGFSAGFVWPLRGEVVTALTTATSRKSDGIEIRGKPGSNVHAAADGVVVYVGVNISMYSKLIIIKHKDDKITIYGHNAHVFVKKGDVVAQGQVISKIGKTNNVKNPKLYFGIRQGRKVLDPIKYLS
jgi:murein DD-endopeptidase MepM/ murein hydrolase activator NlpD